MNITVILCTYNRCGSLAKALNSAANLTLPDSVEWEVLVVDNNSRDHTREVAEEFCNRYAGRFRYLSESQPGKSYALNAGIREARGGILAFMDDDVVVEPTWLQNLTAPLHDGDLAGAGGRILLEWNCSPPHWLKADTRYALAPLAAFDLGAAAGELTEPPFGTNMAFRKEMFEKYGGFRTDLGPRPGGEIRNEDTEFGSRLLAAGERLRYQASAIVYHPVAENRMQKDYFLTWWYDKRPRGCQGVWNPRPCQILPFGRSPVPSSEPRGVDAAVDVLSRIRPSISMQAQSVGESRGDRRMLQPAAPPNAASPATAGPAGQSPRSVCRLAS
jgi:glycosyltransferase involved in cell wall biosynthesis